ncbi:MAG TPA: 4Fe-4S dicluster domain-containing protein [Blastocatellia bacterium]|jgi:molybdopterin-containing oxidoreductase family iron-sulfur binding subunit|nr:4Fe-4S dicluster domain-containing protein [Blastocatellia bacterium]
MTSKASDAKEKGEATAPQWAMVIDLDRCTGCEACVVACHAENNIRIAGDDESARGRSVNWIRVERYFEGEYPNVRARFMPVLCQHCDEAPCEPVCPVYATYHTEEGLNAQVYNRCVGTRYCANNCPYTVRFFNFYDPQWPEPLEKAWNPEVSIRSKGVMEKCTFCVQRIRKGEEKAKDEGRAVKDGDVVPACVQSCPTKAMAFGNIADPASEVSRLSKSNRASRLMEELGTKPRVIYLNKGD